MEPESTHSCLTEKQMEACLAGATALEDAAVSAHLSQCPRCRQRLADARANEDLLVNMRRTLQDSPGGLHVDPSLLPSAELTLPSSSVDPGVADLPAACPEVIQGYQVLAEIGRGGMGVVYKACQLGTRRIVALKVMLDGPLASAATRRRFEREVELAAGLSHPNIVAVHDSGLSRGRHYFAMDYIEGRRLDRYVKDGNLPVESRLRLMQKICLAVNHAHQRGVIHRDLKPSNILVDGQGEPHILDFGLAKTAEPPAAESRLISIGGQVLGTLPYMAPEQATGAFGQIDSRTDIYALGVILYEMLTGRYPYPVTGQMADVLQNITQAAPQRPRALCPAIAKDLETIVLKALAKDKDHRYDSAGALAGDIGRYMAGEAIEARRDSGWYVFGKTLRRYRWPVSVATGVLVLAILAAIVTLSLYSQAERQRYRAEQNSGMLARQLRAEIIEQGRAVALAGDPGQAEPVIWDKLLEQPGDPHALWALRDLYSRYPCLGRLRVPNGDVTSLAFRPDGAVLASSDRGGTIHLWEMPSRRLLASRAVPPDGVTCVRYRPDGKVLAFSSNDGTVQLWDADCRECLVSLHIDGVDWRRETSPTLTTRGATLAATSGPSSQGKRSCAFCFSPDSRAFAVYGMDETIQLRDAASGQLTGTLAGHQGRIRVARFSPDGRCLASAGHDKTVRLWDVPSGRMRWLLQGHTDVVSTVAFHPDGQVLASGGWDGAIILWDTATGRVLAGLEGNGSGLLSLVFSPDGRTLASADAGGWIRLWDLSTGLCETAIAPAPQTEPGTVWRGAGMAFNPSGDTLACGNSDGTIELWDAAPVRHSVRLETHAGSVISLAATPDGQAWASRSDDGAIRLWNASSGICAGTIEPSQSGADSSPDTPLVVQAQRQSLLAVADGGRTLVVAGDDKPYITLYDLATQQPAGRLEGNEFGVHAISCSSDGRLLVSADRGSGVMLWDVPARRSLRIIEAPEPGEVISACISPDGRLIAVARGAVVRLWRADSGDGVAVLQGHRDWIWSVRISPDGRLLASAANDGVRLWDVASGQCTAVLQGHAGAVYGIAFSPDGRVLACANHNGTLQFWDVVSARCLATLPADGLVPWSLCFSPDGQRLICGGSDGCVRVWNPAYYDRHIQGNGPYFVALANQAHDLGPVVDGKRFDAWVRDLVDPSQQQRWATLIRAVRQSNDPSGLSAEKVDSWGRTSRQRLLIEKQQ